MHAGIPSSDETLWLNDIHSRSNLTKVARLDTPQDLEELRDIVLAAGDRGDAIAVSGSRHAMGGQQFLSGGVALDLRGMRKVLDIDEHRGLLRVQAGIEWPELISGYLELQGGDAQARWGIAQKQTGSDNFTLGGSLAANAHGRGLCLAPIVQDVEAFSILMADGEQLHCSRVRNQELFSLALGGYGLFGAITEVTLRLVPRKIVERVVELGNVEDLPHMFQERIDSGYLYGDFQFAIDENSPSFLRVGVLSCYRPTERPLTVRPRTLSPEDWLRLLHLAYTDRNKAFEQYAAYYLQSSGQVYMSDTLQLGPYLPDYALRIQQMTHASSPASLMITEIYVPVFQIPDLLKEAASLLRELKIPVIYGTVRLIEQDSETFLSWARRRYACIVFNLLQHGISAERERIRDAFRGLIDLAIARGGSYYLTYHRHATLHQRNACYPQFPEFLHLKRKYDPAELFQSDWYRHQQALGD